MYKENAEVIVVGAGHAGCEAAVAAAKMGRDTILLTLDLDKVARMSCNPAIGGPGKSQLVREIDALGGIMARITDKTSINVRRLNTSKGPAMQVTRAQVDRDRYVKEMKWYLENLDNLLLREGLVTKITTNEGGVSGVVTREGVHYLAPAVILTSGTFLRGRVYIGEADYPAGRTGEPPAEELSDSLERLGLNLERMNTDTTPRVNGGTIDFSGLESQEPDEDPFAFSYRSEKRVVSDEYPVCITQTNEKTHEIIRDNIDRNPRYNGSVVSAHPRYCPSLESKIVDFPQRNHHKVFLEPEGRKTREYYLQGIYTSSPPDVQREIVQSMDGLENAHIERYGYGIEYDYLPPTQVKSTLETKRVRDLFTAGQINGTTGYEEAAGQGILAGINASLPREEQIVLERSEAFLGVMVDDLVTKGVKEPYRMLPSRAEYRILLRENNADLRLTKTGRKVGLVSGDCYEKFSAKEEKIENTLDKLQSTRVTPSTKVNEILNNCGTSPLTDQGATLYQLLKRPEVGWEGISSIASLPSVSQEVREEIEIRAKYEGYIKKQKEQIQQFERMEKKEIPTTVDYDKIEGLSTEGKERLEEVEPRTLGQAERIPGVTRSDITILTVWLS